MSNSDRQEAGNVVGSPVKPAPAILIALALLGLLPQAGCLPPRQDIADVCFSRDGQQVAWSDGSEMILGASVAQEGHVCWSRIDELDRPQRLKIYSGFGALPCGYSSPAARLEFSPDGRRLAFSYSTGLSVLDLATGQRTELSRSMVLDISSRWTGNDEITAVLWPSLGGVTKLVRYCLPEGEPREVLSKPGTVHVAGEAWSPDARRVVIGASQDYETLGPAEIIDTATGAVLATLGDSRRLESVCWTRDGRTVCLLQQARPEDDDPPRAGPCRPAVLLYDLANGSLTTHEIPAPAGVADWKFLSAVWVDDDARLLLTKAGPGGDPIGAEWFLLDPNTGTPRSIRRELTDLLNPPGRLRVRPLALPGFPLAAGEINSPKTYAISRDLKRAVLLTKSRGWSLSPDARTIAEQGPWGSFRVRSLRGDSDFSAAH